MGSKPSLLAATLPGTGGKALVPGDRLGRYQLIKRLAVGGMAEIFLARAQGIDGFEKLVVCKCILAERAGDQSWVDAFLDEARLAATLAHPNIAQVFDVGRERDLHFFTMEYVHGADLREVQSAAKGALPLEIAVAIVVGVASGLHYAHEQCDSAGRPLNIVHRDVSPSNVLISYDGAVKVVDFGIAKAAVRRAATRTGTIKGKAGYMSPEQCRGEALDRRSDLFAIGILLYQLTTGVVPFDEENEYAIIRRVVDEDVASPTTIRADYPPALEAICMRALRRSRDERYSTAQEMQVDLETFARDAGLNLSAIDVARYMEEIFGDRRQQHLQALAALVGEANVQQLSTTFVRVSRRKKRKWGGTIGLAVAAVGLTVIAWGMTRRPAPLTPVLAAQPVPAHPAPVPPPPVVKPLPGESVPVESAAPTPAPTPARARPAARRRQVETRRPRPAETDLDAPLPR